MEARRFIKIFLLIFFCNLVAAEMVKKKPVVVKAPKKFVKKPVFDENAKPKIVKLPVDKNKLKVPSVDELKNKEAAPIWQKEIKDEGKVDMVHDDKDVEGGGDGPIEDALHDDGNIKETEPETDDEMEPETDNETDDGDEEEEEEEEEEDDDEDETEYYDDDEDFIKPWDNKVAGQPDTGHPEKAQPKKKVPSLVMLTRHMFFEKIKAGKSFIVNLGNLGCDKCQAFYEDYRLVLHYFHDTKQRIETFLITDKQLLEDFQFQHDEYPAILYYRHNMPILYDGPLTATGVQSWVEKHSKRAAVELTDKNFDRHVKVTNDKTTQWVVLFCDPHNIHCWRPLALTETLATRLKGIVNVGVVDTTKNPGLLAKLKDKRNLPSVYLFREEDMIQLKFDQRLTLEYFNETYKEATLTLQEKLTRAAVQVKGFLLYSGGVITVILLVFALLCSKVARVGERKIKKGV